LFSDKNNHMWYGCTMRFKLFIGKLRSIKQRHTELEKISIP
jgi:hypothetical protein